MRKIESFQMKKIYAIGHALGITGNGSEDELHILVSGVTGKRRKSEGADQRDGGSGKQKLLRRTGECFKRSFWSFKNIFKQG